MRPPLLLLCAPRPRPRRRSASPRFWGHASRATRRPSGFTLVELVVVMAVITILAALLLPVLSGSTGLARSANCKSNLRQFGAAFAMYYGKHGGFMCPKGSPGKNPPHRFPHWCKNLRQFTRDDEVFRCPSKHRVEYGYGMNHMWCGPDQIYPGAAMNDRSKQVSEVRRPARTLLFCDAGVVENKDDPPEKWGEKMTSNTNGAVRFPYDNRPGIPGKYKWWHKDPRRPVPRHSLKKTNVGFFDNHVEGIETRDIVDDLWDEPGCIYDNDGHPKRL